VQEFCTFVFSQQTNAALAAEKVGADGFDQGSHIFPVPDTASVMSDSAPDFELMHMDGGLEASSFL
jgi:hypothetical protein